MSETITVKIVEKGWAGYTGNLGTAVFENGVAEITRLEANRIGATIKIVELDEDDGETVVNVADAIVKNRANHAEIVKPLDEASEADIEKDAKRVIDKMTRASGTGEHTREKLEAIADAEGIKGIREIATPLGLKSTSIAALIDMILNHTPED